MLYTYCMHYVDCFIVGSGVAGLSAGIYTGRFGLTSVVMGKELGGAALTSWIIENYPGFTSIEGYEFIDKLVTHCKVAGTPVHNGVVEKIVRHGNCFVVYTSEGTYTTASIIFANGAERRVLGLPMEKELTGKGVHYCVTCDGPFFRGKHAAVVGGGDASLKSALLLSQFAKHVDVLVREPVASGDTHNLKALEKLDTVTLHYSVEVTELLGSPYLTGVRLSRELNGSKQLEIAGLFVEIGSIPDPHIGVSIGCALDAHGYLAVDTTMATSVPGVFAAGDACNLFGSFKQDVTAAAQGAVAAHSAFTLLVKEQNSCHYHHKHVTHHHHAK